MFGMKLHSNASDSARCTKDTGSTLQPDKEKKRFIFVVLFYLPTLTSELVVHKNVRISHFQGHAFKLMLFLDSTSDTS